jgi:hypothetical protein
MRGWRFLTNHARALLCIAQDPGMRLRDIAAMVGVTERSAHDIVSDLVDAGYVVKDKAGRRNRYRIQEHLPLRDPISRERTIAALTRRSLSATRLRMWSAEPVGNAGVADVGAEHVALAGTGSTPSRPN